MLSSIWKWTPAKLLLALAAGVLAAPVWAVAPGRPGTVNYVEGNVTLQGAILNSHSIGSAEVGPGQVLQTQQGRAEILLTPGVFFRVGDNSQVRMVSPDLVGTRVELLRGTATVEAAELLKGTNVQVAVKDARITVTKPGLYEFTSDPPQVRVYDGKADVSLNDTHVDAGKGREVLLYGRLHATKFDRNQEDSLYAWSRVRSESLAEASVSSARSYVAGVNSPAVWYGAGWYGSGWYWNPGWDMYSFIPGDGVWLSPFGWGFYAPSYLWYAPVYRGFYHGGRHRIWPAGHAGAVRPGFRSSGMAASPRSFGAFHGGGGFHGGGFHGGGFHGGGGSHGGRR